jgi:Flp pilus assembly protein TadG
MRPQNSRKYSASDDPMRVPGERLPRHPRGQSLVEFALILPILLMLVGGVVQYGILFATKQALVQVGRDVGRWAATQTYSPCNTASSQTPPQPVTEADLLAQQSQVLGYSAGGWNSSNFTSYGDQLPSWNFPAAPPKTEGVEVAWTFASGTSCPPADSSTAAFVTVRLTHRAPIVLPGFAYLPALGTCDASGCYLTITTTSEFRMQPPQP